MAFVIGSYFLAQEVKVKRPQRRSKAPRAAEDAVETVAPRANGSAAEQRPADEPASRR